MRVDRLTERGQGLVETGVLVFNYCGRDQHTPLFRVSHFWRSTFMYALLYAVVNFLPCIVRANIVLLEVMSASLPVFGILSGPNNPNRRQGKEADPWNLPLPSLSSYSILPPSSRLRHFRPSWRL